VGGRPPLGLGFQPRSSVTQYGYISRSRSGFAW
jgi:hypothetical protein